MPVLFLKSSNVCFKECPHPLIIIVQQVLLLVYFPLNLAALTAKSRRQPHASGKRANQLYRPHKMLEPVSKPVQ